MDRASLSEAEAKWPPCWNSTVQWLSSCEKEAQAVLQTVNENKANVGCIDTSPNVASAGFTVSLIRLQRCATHLFWDQWLILSLRYASGSPSPPQVADAGHSQSRCMHATFYNFFFFLFFFTTCQKHNFGSYLVHVERCGWSEDHSRTTTTKTQMLKPYNKRFQSQGHVKQNLTEHAKGGYPVLAQQPQSVKRSVPSFSFWNNRTFIHD